MLQQMRLCAATVRMAIRKASKVLYFSTRNVKVMSRMCDMTNMLLIGEVKGPCPPGCRRSSFDDVALSDCQKRRMRRLYRDAQDRLLWIDKTCPAHYV